MEGRRAVADGGRRRGRVWGAVERVLVSAATSQIINYLDFFSVLNLLRDAFSPKDDQQKSLLAPFEYTESRRRKRGLENHAGDKMDCL